MSLSAPYVEYVLSAWMISGGIIIGLLIYLYLRHRKLSGAIETQTTST